MCYDESWGMAISQCMTKGTWKVIEMRWTLEDYQSLEVTDDTVSGQVQSKGVDRHFVLVADPQRLRGKWCYFFPWHLWGRDYTASDGDDRRGASGFTEEGWNFSYEQDVGKCVHK